MQRGSGNRTYYNKTASSLNLVELSLLSSVKGQIRSIVQEYIDKKTDRDSTLSNLAQISQEIKTKISMIA